MNGQSGRNPEYVEVVLAPGFAFARKRLARFMLEVNVAHVLTLLKAGHLRPEDGRALRAAVGAMLAEGLVPKEYDPAYEDLFFMLEAEVERRCGAETAGSLHLGLSRNDLDTTIFRMAARERLIELAEGLNRLREAVLEVAAREAETVMPAYTHNQQAQPTTFGHYLAGVEEALGRDADRLADAWRRTNLSPLGAAALAGSGFAVDRAHEAELLGFEGLVENTYDAVAAADYLIELSAAAAVLATDLSRFVTDLLYWCTNEVAALRLAPEFIQVSSIMPQKRNPVALEHLRALIGKVVAASGSAALLLHNVPFGDVNDAGEQLQPVVHGQADQLGRVMALLTALVSSLAVDRDLLAQRAADSFATSTELADTLVRVDGLRFRQAHRVVSDLVTRLAAGGRRWWGLTLAELNEALLAQTGQTSLLSAADLARALDPAEFVARRRNMGGPARERLAEHLAKRGAKLTEEQGYWRARCAGLEAYRRRLAQS